jgi:hypothetical protein
MNVYLSPSTLTVPLMFFKGGVAVALAGAWPILSWAMAATPTIITENASTNTNSFFMLLISFVG